MNLGIPLNVDKYIKSIESSFLVKNEENSNRNFYNQLNFFIGRLKGRLTYWFAPIWCWIFQNDIFYCQLTARKNGGLSAPYQWVRLWELDRIIRYYKLSNILEFGSGASSILFAKRMGAKKSFVSVEESEYWAERTKNIAGKYKDMMQLEIADRMLVFDGTEDCTKYNLPDTFYDKYWDAVYIDGPTARVLPEDKISHIKDKKGFMPNIDIEKLIDNGVPPRIIIIDGRRPTVRRLALKYNSLYEVFLRSYYKSSTQKNNEFLYHSILIRK